MNIHEYQAKAVLREFGVPVPRGVPAFSVDEAVKARARARRPGLGGEGADPCRRPRQGRRRQGRQIDRRREERSPQRMLGSTLVTHQTGPQGKQVSRLYIEEGSADRPRVLSLDAGRPRDLARRLRRLDRRRHGHRAGRARHAGEDHHVPGRSGDRHHAASRPCASRRRSARLAICQADRARC